MGQQMATGVFRLKGSKILEIGKGKGVENIHQISMRSGVSYPTAHRWVEKPEQVEAISLRALYGILVDGIGLSLGEVSALKVSDIFELVPDEKKGSS